MNQYRICGDRGDLVVEHGYAFPGPLHHRLTIGDATSERSFAASDQFGAETRYFSDCILNDHDPEPDGEEGRLDVRVVAAIERALQTGTAAGAAAVPPGKASVAGTGGGTAAGQGAALVNAAAPSDG